MNRITLKDCCAFQEGYVNPSQKIRDYFNGPIKWLRASDLNDGFVYNTEQTLSNKGFESAGKSAFLFNANTIAISKSGTIGRLGILKDRMCGNRAVINIDVNKQVADLFYVFYTLIYKKAEILSKAGGSIQKNLYVSALETISLNHKVLTTQKSIAKVLSDLDAKIELNNRINRELEAMAKTLYDYWFVQFDFPNEQGKPYKSSGGKMVYNAELKRKIPEGWEVKKLGEYAEVKKGELITEKDTVIGNIKVVAAGVVFSYFHNAPNRKKNTITISGSGANAGYINFWREPIFASDCITVRCNSDIETILILQFLNFIQAHILKQATGSAQPHVYPNDIKILNYVVPPKNLVIKFGNIIIPMNDNIANNLKQNQKLSELRDWLLPMLMNGQVTVKVAEERLSMAAEPSVEYKKG